MGNGVLQQGPDAGGCTSFHVWTPGSRDSSTTWTCWCGVSMEWWMEIEDPATKSVKSPAPSEQCPLFWAPSSCSLFYLSTWSFISAWRKALSFYCYYTHAHMHAHTHYKELTHIIMVANIPSFAISKWRPRRADGVVPV